MSFEIDVAYELKELLSQETTGTLETNTLRLSYFLEGLAVSITVRHIEDIPVKGVDRKRVYLDVFPSYYSRPGKEKITTKTGNWYLNLENTKYWRNDEFIKEKQGYLELIKIESKSNQAFLEEIGVKRMNKIKGLKKKIQRFFTPNSLDFIREVK